MAGLVGGVAVLTDVLDSVLKNGLSSKTLLDLAESKGMSKLKADGSIMKILGQFTVSPTIFVSNDLKSLEEIDDLIGMHIDTFMANYMQIFDILRNMYDMDFRTVLDKLNTDNGGLNRALLKSIRVATEEKSYVGEMLSGDFTLSTEASAIETAIADYDSGSVFGNDSPEGKSDNSDKMQTIRDLRRDSIMHKRAQENRINNMTMDKYERGIKADEAEKTRLNTLKHTAANRSTIREAARASDRFKDLFIPNAIQRNVDITVELPVKNLNGSINEFGKTITFTIPLTIKANVLFGDEESVLIAMDPNKDENSFRERLFGVKAGLISYYDFLLAGDLIKKYKKNKLRNKNQLLDIIQSRIVSSNSKALDDGMVGFEKYYTMYILSKDSLSKIEETVRGKLTNSRYREKFLEQAYGLSLTIVDTNYKIVTIGFKDIKGESTVNLKTVTKVNKNNKNDNAEIVKALLTNRAPTF